MRPVILRLSRILIATEQMFVHWFWLYEQNVIKKQKNAHMVNTR